MHSPKVHALWRVPLHRRPPVKAELPPLDGGCAHHDLRRWRDAG